MLYNYSAVAIILLTKVRTIFLNLNNGLSNRGRKNVNDMFYGNMQFIPYVCKRFNLFLFCFFRIFFLSLGRCCIMDANNFI